MEEFNPIKYETWSLSNIAFSDRLKIRNNYLSNLHVIDNIEISQLITIQHQKKLDALEKENIIKRVNAKKSLSK